MSRYVRLSLFVLVLLGLMSVPAQAATSSTKTVQFRGASVTVPTSWPVYDFSSLTTGCLRTDRHAVYLGVPKVEDCPAHLVGGLSTVSINDGVVSTTGTGVGAIRASVRGARLAARPQAAATTQAPAATASTAGGFDACTAPTVATMKAWLASPYRTVNIYVGGSDRGCSQPNLTASWVTQVTQLGFDLIPTYVGLQAPCWTGGGSKINASQAASQGSASADDAVSSMAALGLSAGNPIYLDMESYDTTNSSCVTAVESFADAWTVELHANGYRSGYYSSAATGITNMVQETSNPDFHLPDDLWFAHYNGNSSVYGDSYIPDNLWDDHQRIHQFQGGHNETYGGVTINIDSDGVDGSLAPSSPQPTTFAEGSYIKVLDGNDAGLIARVVGGYLFTLGSCGALPGCSNPMLISDATYQSYMSAHTAPVDGTYVAVTSSVYAAAGGALIPVQSCTSLAGCGTARQINSSAYSSYVAAVPSPADGTVIEALASGRFATYSSGCATLGAGTTSSISLDENGFNAQLCAGTPTAGSGGTAPKVGVAVEPVYSLGQVAVTFAGPNSSFDVRYRTAGLSGAFSDYLYPSTWEGTTLRTESLPPTAGTTYCFSVRARNAQLVVSAWSSEMCTAAPVDDRGLKASSGWAQSTASQYYAITISEAKASARTLTLSNVTTRRISLLATTCSTCGSVSVTWNGTLLKNISLVSQQLTYQHLLTVADLGSARTGTLVIKTRTANRVDVDGVGLSRT